MENNKQKSGIKAFIFAGLGVGLLLIGFYFTLSKPKFDIVDIYTDSSDAGKYIFIFVETDAKNKNDYLNWAYNIKHSDNMLDMPDKTLPAIMTVYFYNPADTTELNNDMRDKLLQRYPDKEDFTNKINFTDKGWQYIGHDDPTIVDFPSDTVYQTNVFVPKPGYKAFEIINK